MISCKDTRLSVSKHAFVAKKINSTYDVVDVDPGIHVYKRVQTSWQGFQASETVPAQCTESVFYIRNHTSIH